MANQAVLPPREDGFARKKWNVQECRSLTTSGLLDRGKYELIEGEIVFKMGQSRIHIAILNKILFALAAIFGAERIQNQAQIGIGESDPFNDPEPDIAVLGRSVDEFLDREPDPPSEVLLLVEVSNTSLKGDTTVKAHVYARHGIPEYWVVSIPTREIIVFRRPGAEGYADTQTFGEDAMVSPLSAPEAAVRVAELFPSGGPAPV